MKLLVVFDLSPDAVTCFVVEEKDENYSLLKQAHGLYVNSNDSDYPIEVVEAVSKISEESINMLDQPLVVSGDCLVIQCGFAC